MSKARMDAGFFLRKIMENPTANFKPCFDWEMAEETSTEGHQTDKTSKALEPDIFVPPAFTNVATRKLLGLLAEGFQITGYSIEKQASTPGVEPKRGFCTAGGFVGWWARQS